MGWTKRQFIEQAYTECGYATYEFDLQPEQLETAMRRLDSMLATWNGKGIRLGYPIPSSPQNSDLDQETSVPDSANEAIYTNLAIRIAPIIGKTISAETKTAARVAYMELLSRFAKAPQQQFPSTLPLGAGNKPWRFDNPFMEEPNDPLLAGDDSELNFE